MPIAAVTAVVAAAAAPALSRRETALAVPELPKAPDPVTPASAAVHIMRVPHSRLLEGFASLQQAAVAQTPAAEPAVGPRAAAAAGAASPSTPMQTPMPAAMPASSRPTDLAQRVFSATMPAPLATIDLKA
jgi:hypothetical protein